MGHYGLLGALLALLTVLPLAWKWQLGMLRVGLTILLLCLLAAVVVSTPALSWAMTDVEKAGLEWLLVIIAAFGLLAYRFYRDPERTPPARSGVIVSPADGRVIYVRRSENGVLPFSTKNGHHYKLSELTKTSLRSQEAVVVGISMSFLDVHVTRTPCSGRVSFRKHFYGLFGSLRRPEMIFENERATTVIENDGYQVAVVQIASRLVRQIAVFLREGQDVALGQRMGVIRLGSQVDVVLPMRENLIIAVRPGDHVRAGESIIAMLNSGLNDSKNCSQQQI